MKKPSFRFHSMFSEQASELVVLIKYVVKLQHVLRGRLNKTGAEEEKLFSSPKKPSHTFTRALIELKSYCLFLMSGNNINTGRELNEIKRAVDEYLNPTARTARTGGFSNHKVFMSPVALASED